MIFGRFIRILGEPKDRKLLLNYISFCKNNLNIDESIYSENHLLPVAVDKSFIKVKYNIIRLTYKNHIEAHKMLVECYPIRKFFNPLHFMCKGDVKYSRSEAIKQWWIQFKSTNEYQYWIEKHRISTNNFENFNKAGKEIHLINIKTSEHKNKIKNTLRKFWDNVDDEYLAKLSEQRKLSMTLEVREKISNTWKERWKDEKYHKKMCEKMTVVNADLNKRKSSGEKIKLKWEDPYFREKMQQVIETRQIDYKAHSNTMKNLWSDPEFREKMLEARKNSKKRKNNETIQN
jgi:hypothetical protein